MNVPSLHFVFVLEKQIGCNRCMFMEEIYDIKTYSVAFGSNIDNNIESAKESTEFTFLIYHI